jgi:hypothetical protein
MNRILSYKLKNHPKTQSPFPSKKKNVVVFPFRQLLSKASEAENWKPVAYRMVRRVGQALITEGTKHLENQIIKRWNDFLDDQQKKNNNEQKQEQVKNKNDEKRS